MTESMVRPDVDESALEHLDWDIPCEHQSHRHDGPNAMFAVWGQQFRPCCLCPVPNFVYLCIECWFALHADPARCPHCSLTYEFEDWVMRVESVR